MELFSHHNLNKKSHSFWHVINFWEIRHTLVMYIGLTIMHLNLILWFVWVVIVEEKPILLILRIIPGFFFVFYSDIFLFFFILFILIILDWKLVIKFALKLGALVRMKLFSIKFNSCLTRKTKPRLQNNNSQNNNYLNYEIFLNPIIIYYSCPNFGFYFSLAILFFGVFFWQLVVSITTINFDTIFVLYSINFFSQNFFSCLNDCAIFLS